MAQSSRAVIFFLIFLMALGLQVQVNEAVAAPATKKATTNVVTKAKAKVTAKVTTTRKKAAAPAKRQKLAKNTRTSSIKRISIAPKAALATAVPAVLTAGDAAGLHMTNDPLALKSNVAFVVDQQTSEVLFEKNANVALPMASITKLMTSLVVLEANQDMDEMLEVTKDDIDREKFTGSRLKVGAYLSRANMLHIALMSSENRAASALGRNYPGGLPAFVKTMNAKAKTLGMTQTRYVDSTGLSSGNVATARDLAKLVVAAHQHALIRYYSTDSEYFVEPGTGGILNYRNSNGLVYNPEWEIGLQKTGYISEAGRCLVMQAKVEGHPVVMVFLDSKGKMSRLADAGRVREWLSTTKLPMLTSNVPSPKG